jgi:GTP-binding protein SAR1
VFAAAYWWTSFDDLSRVHDLGGHDVARELWADYFTAVDSVIFLVDCNDRDRFPEAKAELDKLLSNDQLVGVPFLILGNKIDIQRAASEVELRSALGITHQLTGKSSRKADLPKGMRAMELYMVSVIKRQGYRDGFQWVAQYID